ncbi:hypothetical protein WJX84_010508 [Apatococcus fuscideae]|uniref:Protein kinase domain-containing protein n=1 Tax=Apatococcus fuscideae TaxID=2026836 RepID=A0AAW1T2H2_9CHLO
MAESSGERKVGQWLVSGEIGRGSFASVWKAQHEGTGNEVAIKEICTDKLNSRLRQSLESEVAILKRIDHKNIVHLKEVIAERNKLFLVMEFCAGGDLSGHIRKQEHRRGIPEPQAKLFMQQLAAGLQELWSHSMVHRDLKPQNLLLSDGSPEAVLKIADFGFARHLQPQGLADTLCGSPLYMAPEILQHHRYDAKADLWSVGTIFFELLTGRPPFTGANYIDLTRNILTREAAIPPQLSASCKQLLHGLLRRNPVERISFEEFFSHSFLTGAAPAPVPAAPSQPGWDGPHSHLSDAWRTGPGGGSVGSREMEDEGMGGSSGASSNASVASLYRNRPLLPGPSLPPGDLLPFMVDDEEEEGQSIADIASATSLPLPGAAGPQDWTSPGNASSMSRHPGGASHSGGPAHPAVGTIHPTGRDPEGPLLQGHHLADSDDGWIHVPPAADVPSASARGVNVGTGQQQPLFQGQGATPGSRRPPPVPSPTSSPSLQARLGASSGGFGALPARDVPIRPLPAMRLTWKELHSAAKVLETVAEMQHQHCRHAETLTIHLMSMQLLDLAMKGFATNSRGVAIVCPPQQLPSAAEVVKLEAKLRTVVARAEQVQGVLGRRSGEQQQLPEVWVLLYKVARDMSRAAGAEELVNSFQTAAESYLVAGFLFKFMAAQAPNLPLHPPIALAPQDRHRLCDYSNTARHRRNACQALNPSGKTPPTSPGAHTPLSGRSSRRLDSRHTHHSSARRSTSAGRSESGPEGDALRREASEPAADRQTADGQVSGSSMSGDFGRVSSMGRALSTAAETVPMLAGSTTAEASPLP